MIWRGLLVSVRNAAEATEALAGGASIIDVKEPSRGPLGRADADVTAAIAEAVAGRAPLTVACGELVTGESEIAAHVEAIANDAALDVLRWYSTIGDGNDPTAPADGPDSGT